MFSKIFVGAIALIGVGAVGCVISNMVNDKEDTDTLQREAIDAINKNENELRKQKQETEEKIKKLREKEIIAEKEHAEKMAQHEKKMAEMKETEAKIHVLLEEIANANTNEEKAILIKQINQLNPNK